MDLIGPNPTVTCDIGQITTHRVFGDHPAIVCWRTHGPLDEADLGQLAQEKKGLDRKKTARG